MFSNNECLPSSVCNFRSLLSDELWSLRASGLNDLDFRPTLALSELASGEAPDDEFFSGEVVFAACETSAGGGGSGSHYGNDIHREAEFVAKLVWQAGSGGMHFAAGVKD